MSKFFILTVIVFSSFAASACEEQLAAVLKQKANAYCFEKGPKQMLLGTGSGTGTMPNENTKMFLMECTFGSVIGTMTYNNQTCEVVSISETDTKTVTND